MKDLRLSHLPLILLVLLLASVACNYPGLTPRSSPTQQPSTAELTAVPSATVPASPTPLLPVPSPSATLVPTEPPTSTVPTIAYQPRFEPAPCAFPVPQGYNPECGYLVVPEDRSDTNSPSIRLHVAVFRSRASNPAPDPAVFLSGGPGTSALGLAGYTIRQGLDAALIRRDFVIFDQRGVGYSQPQLDCPEREVITDTLLGQDLPQSEKEWLVIEAFRGCRERLVSQGIDLADYNSASSAADVNDLRLALGYPALNLLGVSYGTRLALTVLRDHPEAVRSAVLDSTYPLQVHLYTSLAPNAERAFEVLFEHCAADVECSAPYPDLRARFYELVDAINAQPLTVSFRAYGTDRMVRVDGGVLMDVLFVGLYQPYGISRMPKMIFDIRRGDYSILRERLTLYFDPSASLGMQMAVQCHEEIPFSQPEEAFRQAEGVQPQVAAFFPASVQPLFAVCEEWASTPPDPRENEPVTSDLPTLVLVGEYDPITPPAWGEMVAEDLPNASYFEFPANGHWVTRSSGCAISIMLAFWESPSQVPDSSCISKIGGVDFARE